MHARRRNGSAAALALFGALAVAACGGDPTDVDICDDDGARALSGASCLRFEDGGALDAHRAVITAVLLEVYDDARGAISLDRVGIRVFAGTRLVIPELGFGGRAFSEEIHLVFDPNSVGLAQSIETDLAQLAAHEMHHVVRHRAVGFPGNLLELFVSEGLADHYGVERTASDPPPWSVALQGEELDLWRAEAEQIWLGPQFDIDAWLFGTTAEIPRWAGYSIGFDLVGDYLAADPGRSAAGLVGVPAGQFLSP